jgi:hypothetical protein
MIEENNLTRESFSLDQNSLYEANRNGADVEAGNKKNIDNLGSLAAEFEPKGTGDVNIVNDYAWSMTVTKGLTDVPFIKLKEYRVNELSIKRAASFFAAGGSFLNPQAGRNRGTAQSTLDAYDELFPRDNPTGWRYTFPFFSENNMELTTAPWTEVDAIEAVKEAIGQLSPKAKEGIELIESGIKLYRKVTTAGVINIFDRPKVFNGHTPRSIRVEFPLYNTITPADEDTGGAPWKKNKDFLFLFMNQNLFNKRDLTTGISPVFYEVLIPGQFYSVACCVTDIKVTNLGAVRTMYTDSGKPFIVPDVYQVSITLTEMVMPSRNSFQASDTLEGYNRVTSRGIVRSRQSEEVGERAEEIARQIKKEAKEAKDLLYK